MFLENDLEQSKESLRKTFKNTYYKQYLIFILYTIPLFLVFTTQYNLFISWDSERLISTNKYNEIVL